MKRGTLIHVMTSSIPQWFPAAKCSFLRSSSFMYLQHSTESFYDSNASLLLILELQLRYEMSCMKCPNDDLHEV